MEIKELKTEEEEINFLKPHDINRKQDSDNRKQDNISYEVVLLPKTFKIEKPSFSIFGRNFYKLPLNNICDEIKVYDNTLSLISYEIRTVDINPYDIHIKTYFNENNHNILKGEINKVMSEIYPKYEHYINWSSSDKLFITCLNTVEVSNISCKEINVNKKIVKDNITTDSLLF